MQCINKLKQGFCSQTYSYNSASGRDFGNIDSNVFKLTNVVLFELELSWFRAFLDGCLQISVPAVF